MPKKTTTLKKILYYPKKNYRSAVQILKLLAEKEPLTTQKIAELIKTANNHHGTKLQLEYLASLGYCEDYCIVSNPDHICNHCKKTTNFLVKKDYLNSALAGLEKNHKLREQNSNKTDFNPDHYFKCRFGYVLGRLVGLTCKNCMKYVESHNDDEYKVYQDRLWMLTQNGRFLFLVLFKNQKQYDFIKKYLTDKIFELVNVLMQSQEKHVVNRLIKKLKDEMVDTPNLQKITNEWYDDTFDQVMNSKYVSEIHAPLKEYQIKYYFDYAVKRNLQSRGKKFS